MVGINEGAISAAEAAFGGIKVIHKDKAMSSSHKEYSFHVS